LEVGTAPRDTFRELVMDSRQGVATVLCDTHSDNRSAHAYDSWYKPRGIRAMIAVPLLRGGEPVAVLAVVGVQPRDWTASEIELVRRVADIVWPAFEKARSDRALAASEERLLLAQSIAQMGTWEWDPASNKCFFSHEGHELFGMSRNESHNFDELLARVDPRDSLALQAALEACRQTGAAEIEFRYLHPARDIRWLHAKAGLAYNTGRLCVVGIALDVTERRHAEDALVEVNQRKDEFLAMLAHELRNPLAPIRSAAQILQVHGKANTQLDWARSVIERQAIHLTRLVDDLLDVSRIVRGKIVLAREPLELKEAIHNAIETSRPIILERHHQLEVKMPEGDLQVEGDLTRLAQVLANLLINAAKYTNEGGQIRIEGRREGPQAVVRVRDSGIGIAQSLLPHVFDLFTQGERTLDRSQGGLGIGCA
jgi:PAS domain S-box-containing protein